MEKKSIKNKAISNPTRELKTFGSEGKEYTKCTIKKDYLNLFISGDTVYLTKELQDIYKDKGLI